MKRLVLATAIGLSMAGGAMAQIYEKTTVNCRSAACSGTNPGTSTTTIWTNGVKGTPVTTATTSGVAGRTTTFASCSTATCAAGTTKAITNRNAFRQDIKASKIAASSTATTYPYTRTNTKTYGCSSTGCKTETTVRTCTAAGTCSSNSTPGTCTAGSTGCSKGKVSTCTSGSCPNNTRGTHAGNNGQGNKGQGGEHKQHYVNHNSGGQSGLGVQHSWNPGHPGGGMSGMHMGSFHFGHH